MDRSRDYSWTVRTIAIAGMLLFAALFLGAQRSWASPAAPVGPAEITVTAPTVPTVATLPPKPCLGNEKCLPPLQPCFTLPGHNCQPPTLHPCPLDKNHKCQPPTKTPDPKTPTSDPTTPSTPTPQATPSHLPTAIPTPNRIDTGGGPTTAAADAPDWLYWVLPGLLVLVLAGAAGGLWLVRSEARR